MRLWVTLAVVAGLTIGPSVGVSRSTHGQAVLTQIGGFFVPRLLAAMSVAESAENYGTNATCTLTGVQSGDLLIFVAYGDSRTDDTSATLTNETPVERADSGTATPAIAVYTAVATASESKTWTPTNSGTFAGAHCFRVTGSEPDFEAIATIASGTSQTPTTNSVACAGACLVFGFADIRLSGNLAPTTSGFASVQNGDGWTNVNADSAVDELGMGSHSVAWSNDAGSAAWIAVAMSVSESGEEPPQATSVPSSLLLLGVGQP